MNYSEWASLTAYVKKKNNKIKARSDFSMGLNECLETYNYPLLSLENIFVKLSGDKVSSKLNLSEVYLQILVDKECVKYLTINIKKNKTGLYRFNRLPFRIKVASGIFQQIMDTLLNDADFPIAYFDNILRVKAENIMQNMSKMFLKKLSNMALWINVNFLTFKIKYLGQIIKAKDL